MDELELEEEENGTTRNRRSTTRNRSDRSKATTTTESDLEECRSTNRPEATALDELELEDEEKENGTTRNRRNPELPLY